MLLLLSLVTFIVLLLLTAVYAIKILPNPLGAFEIRRLAKSKQNDFLYDLEREERLSDLKALRYLAEIIIIVVFIGLALARYNFVFALIGVLLVPAMARVPIVQRRSQELYDYYEPALVRLSAKLHPVLKWFVRETSPKEYRVHSKEEFVYLAGMATGILSKEEIALIYSGLSFHDKSVHEIMTPQSVIECAAQEDIVGPVLLYQMHTSGHSRFPVIDGDINHIVGILYLHDLVPLAKETKTVKQVMQSRVFYIRDDAPLDRALRAFLRTHHHMCIVVNEYRETVGVLTLEDVIEALLGRKIIDEFDEYDDLRAVAETNPRKNNQPKLSEDV